MAMVIMGANIAGIYGAQIFRADDRPRYRRGFSIGIAVLALGVSLAVLRFLDDVIRRKGKGNEIEETRSENEEGSEMNEQEKRIGADRRVDGIPQNG